MTKEEIIATGTAGIVGTELIPHATDVLTMGNINPTINIILQIVLGVITVIKLLKKDKKEKNTKSDEDNEKLQE